MNTKEMPDTQDNNPVEVENRYFNRELSWLAFNKRVLNLCLDEKFPLLERLRFLSIVANNLDEFFEIRVAGLQQQLESGVEKVGFDGLGPSQQLKQIEKLVKEMVESECECLMENLYPKLAEQNIHFTKPSKCTNKQKEWLRDYFNTHLKTALTPLAIDPAHPFPHLRNKGTYVILTIADSDKKRSPSSVAVVPIPPILARVIKLENTENDDNYFVFLGGVIKYFCDELFPGYTVRNKALLRITRNSDLYFDEEETLNLLKSIENELHNRRKGATVRIEIEDCVQDSLLNTLVEAMDIDMNWVFKIRSMPMNLSHLALSYDYIDRPDLKFPPFKPYLASEFDEYSMFDLIKNSDILLHHPYESFLPIEKFIMQAAEDSSVLAIKMTLYRVNSGSSILKALKVAANRGKQVTVLVELKARFDEENNIKWARELEEEGVHVVYGIVGLKTHCKTCLIVRQEGETLKRYVHLGTGNYNSKTARIYTDLSFFTTNDELTLDVSDLFNTLTGRVKSPKFKKLMVAPFSFHSTFIELIEQEIKNAKEGKPARIIIKVNSVIEKDSINKLYEASRAGVKIDMIVRGICGLVPNVEGMSENITVRSIVGTYLEHSRIYYFENAGKEIVYIGSGDIMSRNMFRRIECIFPIENEDMIHRIKNEILDTYLKDNSYATLLNSDGEYSKIQVEASEEFSSQKYFMDLANNLNKK